MSAALTKSIVEDAALTWLEGLGCSVLHGPEIAEGEPAAERSGPNFRDVVLESRVRDALARLNPQLPPEALEDAFRKLTWTDAPSLIERNQAVHRMLVDGTEVQLLRALLPVPRLKGTRHDAFSESTLQSTVATRRTHD